MKTKIFRNMKIVQTHGRASLLIALLLLPTGLVAQNGVTVSNLVVNAGTVTFNVSWDKNAMPVALWSDTVWVFVDYNDAGVMKRLPLLPGATLTATTPGGKVIEETDNNKGVWVAGNARTTSSFSATVKLLTATATAAGACAYASNYPPVAEYIAVQTIKFSGTPPYEIVLKDSKSGTITRESGSPFSVPAGYVAQSFTDKTGAPGKIKCLVPATFTLTASASGFCTGGAGITFALSGTENGLNYQLLRDATPVRTLPGTGSAATFSGAFNVAGAYTAVSVADADGVYCSVSMAGSRTVSEYPLPAITRSGGDASQTVNQNTAITTITYTASNATGIALSSGNFPSGVAGTANGLVFTVSGTPSVVGTFGYAVTASHTNGCSSAASSGTLTVNAVSAPPGAASTQTWTIGSGTATRIWSAAVRKAQPGCTDATDFGSTNPPTVALYHSAVNSSAGGYLYNWKCFNDYASSLCPSPWRYPTIEDAILLDLALGGTGVTRNNVPTAWLNSAYVETWGAVPQGYRHWSATYQVNSNADYWLNDAETPTAIALLHIGLKQSELWLGDPNPKLVGRQIRCVRP
jgi:hypothetical protein